jgi:hypothetical protein
MRKESVKDYFSSKAKKAKEALKGIGKREK